MSRQFAFLAYQRAFREPLRTAHGQWALREGFIVRVVENGQIGYGEVAPIPNFGSETLESAHLFLGELVKNPYLDVPLELPCCAFAVSSAIRMAVDPNYLNALEGARHTVSALLPAGRQAVEVLKAKAIGGYQYFKWKIGVESVDIELELFEALIRAMPPGGLLRLDANGGLDSVALVRWLDAVGEVLNQVEYLEQPLPVGEEALMARFMKSTGVPIALDESLNGLNGMRWMEQWTGPLVIKPALMGDVAYLQNRIKPVADRVILSSVFETGVGLANALAVADPVGVKGRAIGFDTLNAFDDVLQPMASAPILESQWNLSIFEQLWQSIHHSS